MAVRRILKTRGIEMANQYRDIKQALISKIKGLRNLDDVERGYQISDIVDSLASSLVEVTQMISTEPNSAVPPYDPVIDGDYSDWLVFNNID